MRILILMMALVLVSTLVCADTPTPVKVFILAGQSNMEGKGAVNTLAHLGDDPEYGHLLDDIYKDGEWLVRDDVFIDYLGRSGPLTVGFGSKGGAHGGKIGPELAIGTVLGDAFDEKVLLIKTAWGGKDVAKDFLPPSMGGPGEFYTKMMENVDRVLADIGSVVPGYNDEGYEICGFIWFQGWNDMVNKEKTAAYPERFSAFIADIRKHWKSDKLPIVIGELGADGDKASGGVARFRKAQETIAAVEKFQGNVKLVRTSPYWDWEADKMYRDDVWKKEDEKHKFYRIASDRPYHYLGSGKIYYLMGWAMGHGMMELLGEGGLPPRKSTGDGFYRFAARTVYVPEEVKQHINGAHGGFAVDRIHDGGDGSTYFCLKGVGLIRIDPALTRLEVIGGDAAIRDVNIHNTCIIRDDGQPYFALPSDEAQKVFITDKKGQLIRTLPNPYGEDGGAFRVCDVEVVGGILYAANGYADNVCFAADPFFGKPEQPDVGSWFPLRFGGRGTAHGKFGTAHGITAVPNTDVFTVADRANARLETYTREGRYIGGIDFEPGTMPCDVDYVADLAVVGCLKGAGGSTPAPIHLLKDGNLVSTLKLQEDLGLEGWTHVHNAAIRLLTDPENLGAPRVVIIASGWNPGRIAVLEQVRP
ncbi:MAG: sialate O-acetylesterase [Planctomycetota bacterium]